MKTSMILFTILLLAMPLSIYAQENKANLSGKWELEVDINGEKGSPTFLLKQKGDTITGTYKGRFGEAKVSGTINGKKFEYKFDAKNIADFDVTEIPNIIYKGTLDADSMKGTCDYGGFASGTFTGKRKKDID